MGVVDQLTELLVVLVAAKVGAESTMRLRQPTVIGELILGMVIGVGGLAWVTIDGSGLLEALAQVGVIILLYEVGLEIQLADMVRLGRSSTLVAVIGVVMPFLLGAGAVIFFGIGGGSTQTAMFVGAAMTATSVGITARVFNDLRRLDSDEARVVIGAAVIDDILGLVILAVVVGTLSGDTQTTLSDFVGLVSRVALFLVIAVAIGRLAMPAILEFLHSLRAPGSYLIGVLTLALSIGLAADHLAGLEPIIGSFVAGLIIAPVHHIDRIQTEIRPVAHFFVPIFFVAVGARIDASLFRDLTVLTGGLLITGMAIIGKVVAGLGATRDVQRTVVGVGMIPRGEVGLIFAALGASQLSDTVQGEDIAIVVLMVVLTTLLAPLILARLLREGGATTHTEKLE